MSIFSLERMLGMEHFQLSISVVKFVQKLAHKYYYFSVKIRLPYQKGKILNKKHIFTYHMYPVNSRWLTKKIRKNILYIEIYKPLQKIKKIYRRKTLYHHLFFQYFSKIFLEKLDYP